MQKTANLLQFDQFHLHLKNHYIIFVDTGVNDNSEVAIAKVLKEVGATKTTNHGYTLDKSKVETLDYLVTILGHELTHGDFAWIIYHQDKKIQTVVVTPTLPSASRATTTL